MNNPYSPPRARVGDSGDPFAPRSVAEIDGFIALLGAACDDPHVNAILDKLLSMPAENRRALVHTWVSDLIVQEAPRDFILAIGCLLDDAVAEKTHEVIFRCRR